ncbi:unnamed protein product [Albugo candida]|uniref:Uncharacterized protein n=1 Tax=Albugo candida TaxID=65357 RepID=A0A024GTC9_9STRA|nr:unnamed protein product [Albugo candida]|eukprot:CCI50043.1 unnamed protein product [Albugo candida]
MASKNTAAFPLRHGWFLSCPRSFSVRLHLRESRCTYPLKCRDGRSHLRFRNLLARAFIHCISKAYFVAACILHWVKAAIVKQFSHNWSKLVEESIPNAFFTILYLIAPSELICYKAPQQPVIIQTENDFLSEYVRSSLTTTSESSPRPIPMKRNLLVG